MLANCGSTSGGSPPPPPPPPPSVVVTVSPPSMTLSLGQPQQFTATVTGTANSNVTWQVNGITGGSPGSGTISSTGMYSAPAILPSPPNVAVTAVSGADPRASNSAAVTLQDNISVNVLPATATLPTGGTQTFTANVSGAGGASTGVNWSVNGIAGGNSTVGTVAANGADTAIYTAPAVPPASGAVTVTASSQADSAKSGSASVTITCSATNSITPGTASVALGATQTFTASLCLPAGAAIAWDVNGIAGGNASVGTIASSGAPSALYTAPADLPATNPITIHAKAGSTTASAAVTVTDSIIVNISPATLSLATNQNATFSASVSGTPDAAVSWFVNGIANGNASVGEICVPGSNPCAAPSGPAAGNVSYLTPAAVPAANPVTLTASSRADTSKTGTASVTITCAATNSITPGTANVALGATQTFTASFCLPAGTAIAWDVNGIAGGNTTVGTIASSGGASALYTAPADLPASNPVTIHAKAGSTTATATVTLTDSITVDISPNSLSLAAGQKGTFRPSVSGTSDAAVSWFVNGIANGNTSVGQVCVAGSNPCAAPQGPAAGNVIYLAPASVPAVNPVTLTAASHADASKTGTALVIIMGSAVPVGVTLAPPYAFVPPSTGTLSKQQFFAQVTGTSNTSVTWSVQSGVAGQGCGGAACGSVDANGLYTAPTAAPSPNAITITATSQADSTKSASATIAITSGPVIELILPSSAMAGAVESFPLEVQGVNFVAGSGGTASSILINGTSRGTACQTATTCTTALNPTDLQSAGTLTLQVQNPGPPSTLSNLVPLVIVPFNASEDSIALNASTPTASGKNIAVTDPTTAAASAAIDVDFVGYFTGGNTCGVQGSPLTVARPASGTSTVTICVHGNGLDPTFTYAFTGPPGGDISVAASSISGGFPNTIGLQLQISSTTLPGARTLVIITLNGDRATATGMLEVQ